ncbi:MAG: biopolymer transporter ExbD [Acidobacteriota bacterium]
MKLRDQVRTIKPTVPTASMADIAFLLIIFFMLTTSFSPERTSVKLPESVVRTEVTKDAAIVAITGNGTIMFTTGEEEAVALANPEELGARTKALVLQVPDKEFVIKADREARYQWIDQVLDALRKNGARRIGLLTRPESALKQGGG